MPHQCQPSMCNPAHVRQLARGAGSNSLAKKKRGNMAPHDPASVRHEDTKNRIII
eukprot:CAMPEP_0206451610 /NCGR_PEP_ID=MMETSP0324_2-20121206/19446_1 /ASSEMBLY_ACC=CAM_ASM_000836 /TAXON_ID=2866 /ORGANISM="Crypthecodinium cohnii, Strain Seligo" /LENGTH=54 /DNA_ID=CAMNT_0053921529 /DNA_START=41 /DNA_END=205 /DNA_ORIENTATION=+